MDPSGTAIWGGLMLPDTLPFLSDGSGNSLCLRFGFDGTVSEVICWDHEGGGWKPYGKTLAESLLLDAAVVSEETRDVNLFTFADWALSWISTLEVRRFDPSWNPEALLARMRELGVAEVALHQLQCERSLTTKLQRASRKVGGGKFARSLGVDWSKFKQWLFEPEVIPTEYEGVLSSLTNIPFTDLVYEDWESAAVEARAVLDLRTDLAWPFVVLGRHDERKGNVEGAINHYLAAQETAGSSAGFTAIWSVLSDWRYSFPVGRLMALREPNKLRDDDYLQALASGNPGQGIREYWIKKGEEAERTGRYNSAYRSYYQAGWDLPISTDIEMVLDRLERVSAKAGYDALALLARHHRMSLSS